jgi:hypothetical protein
MTTMFTCKCRAVALGCGVLAAWLPPFAPPGPSVVAAPRTALAAPLPPRVMHLPDADATRHQARRDTLLHLLDTIRGGAFAFDGLRTHARLVVRDSITWDSLWTRLTADRVLLTRGDSLIPVRFPLPAVDFSRDMLIVVARGPMPSTGYGMRIEDVRTSGRELRVDVCNWRPARDAAQFWAIGYPTDIVRVARSALPVRFVDHSRVNSPFDRHPSEFLQCLRGARRPVQKDARRSALP